MKLRCDKRFMSTYLGRVLVPTVIGLTFGVGCAHQQTASNQDAAERKIEKLQSRLQEVERTNGRLNVRIEELEDTVFLLQDRTESNRIALQRRGKIRQGTTISPRAEAPQPAPESYYYGEDNPYGSEVDRRQRKDDERSQDQNRRPVTRIPLSNQQAYRDGRSPEQGDQQEPSEPRQQPQSQQQNSQNGGGDGADEAEIVITEDDFRRFAGNPPSSSSESSSSSSSSKSSGKKAQAPVTDEKLGAKGEDSESVDKPKVGANPLDTYRTSLAQYRSGNYSEALAGFQAFLEAGPKADYVDNALYWIGECHYGLGQYAQAVKFFQRVLRETPDGNKVPDAMLKMSLAFEKLGRQDDSQALLQKLTDRYPTTNAGRLGAQKLSESQ
ncbi:MAG: tol-pal system protein YbgF [Myxococcota bacterium]